MKSAGICAILTLGLAVSACNNEPEETQDISEAIPLDQEAGSDSGAGEAANGVDGMDGEAMDGAPIEPAAPPISETMESGSNERADIYGGESEGADEPPRSKLQPADPPS